ncbi:phenylacetate--CoA ligase family protein [Flagellimonas crocea]|uniref:hypothetical protein n=1 Tax=Flagellimonas crocea TaxID=3067311 RepID=UPI00296FA110|nr:hypothetical protein [Muricauda sp. DH64]
MALLNALRRQLFWYLDGIKGAKIKKHYSEIKDILKDPLSDGSVKNMERDLSNILEHAIATTPFYQNFRGYESLQDFPIIDKSLVLERYDDFKSNLFKESELVQVFSSGSTGIPFRIFQDKEKRNRNTADVIVFLELAGGVFGDRLFFLKLWDDKNRKGELTSWIQNIYAHNVMDSSDSDMEKLLYKLEKCRFSKNIMGYPSFFEELCCYLNSSENKPEIKGVNTIISFAESLKENERKQMEEFFGAPVYERYSNQENGIFAQKTKLDPNRFVLNVASYRFEVLKIGSDEHVGPGEVGRLVVTDLFNFAMPLIRYDTGDMVLYEQTELGRPFFSSIFGRRMDTIYDTAGKIVSPHIFYRVLDYGQMEQFQFVQTEEKSYKFRINGAPKNLQENKIIEFFRTYLGEDAQINFEYVKEIPLLSSGKRKKIASEYKKS